MVALQILQFILTVNEPHHHVRVCLTFDIFSIPQHLPNYYSENWRVDEEFLVELLHSKEPVQRLIHRNVYLK